LTTGRIAATHGQWCSTGGASVHPT